MKNQMKVSDFLSITLAIVLVVITLVAGASVHEKGRYGDENTLETKVVTKLRGVIR